LLDLLAQQWMQAITGRHVHLHAERFLEKKLYTNKVHKREFLIRMIIDEQVEIAVGFRLTTGGRAEQIKRGRTARLDDVDTTL
jgi:hypothetical protein